jgi:RNA polymerase sigma-70 factor, ECF subfamily
MRCWSDDEIADGLRDPARRQAAFRELHAKHGPKLLGFLTRMCRGDRDRAEDLLGRVLYKAYTGLARMEAPCRALPSWLYTVAARTALDELERAAREDPLRSTLPLYEETVQVAAEVSTAVERALDEAVEALLERLDAENPRYRTLLEMEHIGACDRGEIADATGIPRKQIAQYLKRAKSRFTQLAREYPVLAGLERETVAGETR